MKKVSVIVPIYNVENYLEKCLASIVDQTYENLEVILVNDGSTDNSLEICNKYVEKNNWKLINKANGGLSSARNAGLNQMTGDYVFFVDSDDWLERTIIENLVYNLENECADIAECGIYWIYENKSVQDCEKETQIMDKYETLQAYLLQTKKVHSAVWNKLYKRYIFDNLRFAEGRLHEDGFFMYQALYKIKKYVLCNFSGYYYRQNRKGSIMSVTVKPKNILDVTDMMEARNNFFNKNKEYDLQQMSESYFYRTTLTNYITSKLVIKDDLLTNRLENILKQNKSSILKNKYLRIKKIKFILYYYFYPIFKKIYLKSKEV